MIRNSLKNAFTLPIHILTFIVTLVFYIVYHSNFEWIYCIAALIMVGMMYLFTFIIELIISYRSKKSMNSQLNIDIDKSIKGLEYSELIVYYKEQNFSIDNLNSRRVYLESFDVDRGLKSFNSIAFTAIATLFINYSLQLISNGSEEDYWGLVLSTMLIIIVLSPVIYSFVKLMRVTANINMKTLELNIVNKLIEQIEDNMIKMEEKK